MHERVDIAAAVVRLKAGGLVAFPTETVYGLGADALNTEAVARVFRVKGRPSNNPLIVHVSTIEMARTLTTAWDERCESLARGFWPGPLTLVLPKAASVPDVVTAGGPNVAIRMPRHPLALELITALGRPIVGPSANPSGRVSPTTAEHVRDAFKPKDVLVLDGGACDVGIESTVISLAGKMPRILRPGAISREELERVLGVKVAIGSREAKQSGEALESPGQLAHHYAPSTPAVLCDADELAEVLDEADGRAIVLGPLLTRVRLPHVLMPMPMDPAAYATRLYAALREADAEMPALIVVLRPIGETEAWRAVIDRLERACASDM